MGNEADKKFTWMIKNFSTLQSEKIYSDQFVIGGCKWRLLAYPKGDAVGVGYLSLYLEVADFKSLPLGWRRRAKFSFKVVHQFLEGISHLKETCPWWFDEKAPSLGFAEMISLTRLQDVSGFVMNGEVKIVVEVDILEVIGNLDVTQPLKKKKRNDDDVVKETPADWVDVKGFQVLPSQVKSVRRIFEKHPDFASEFRSKNRHLKWTYMNVLLGIIETVCQLPEELSDEDLDEASVAVSYVAKGGFKLDWLEKKLKELKTKKKKVNTSNARLKEMKEELQKFNQKCLDLKALVEKENAEVLGANVRFSFDDVV